MKIDDENTKNFKDTMINFYSSALNIISFCEEQHFEEIKESKRKFEYFIHNLDHHFGDIKTYINRVDFNKLNEDEQLDFYDNYKKSVKKIIQDIASSHKKEEASNTFLDLLFDLDEDLINFSRLPFFPFRRENYIHQFHVFLLGLILINYFHQNSLTLDFAKSFSGLFFGNVYNIYFIWTICSLFHDVGKIFDITKDIGLVDLEDFINLNDFFNRAEIYIDWNLIFKSSTYPMTMEELKNNLEKEIEKLSSYFQVRGYKVSLKLLDLIKDELNHIFESKELTHGILFGCIFPNVMKTAFKDSNFSKFRRIKSKSEGKGFEENEGDLIYSWLTAAFAIIFHHHTFTKVELKWEEFPFICMLKVCDKIQDFYRKTTIEKYHSAILQGYEIEQNFINLKFSIYQENPNIDLEKIKSSLEENQKEFDSIIPITNNKTDFIIKIIYSLYELDGKLYDAKEVTIKIFKKSSGKMV